MTANTNITARAPFGAIAIHGFVTALTGFFESMIEARRKRVTRSVLYSLSDDSLRDIGLSRWDIERSIR